MALTAAMGAFSVSSALTNLSRPLLNLGNERVSLCFGLGGVINKLRSELSLIRDVLGDAEEKKVHRRDVLNWLQQLKDFAYDAEDLLEEFELKVAKYPGLRCPDGASNATRCIMLRALIGDERMNKVRCLGKILRNPSAIVPLLIIADRIKALMHTFEELLKTRAQLQLMAISDNETHQVEGPQQPSRRPETTSICNPKFEMAGRDKEKNELMDQMLGSNPPTVSVLSIVGIGGMGKSTLARVVYNDPKVTSHFQTRKWVSVGEAFNPKVLIKKLLHENLDQETLQDLHDKLKNKCMGWGNFLIVFDDVWNEDSDEWRKLWDPLTHGMEGSKVLITCRSEKVIRTTLNTPTIVLKGLDDGDCFSIFMSHAFPDGKLELYPRLVKIGEKIAKKLGGLPLIAKVVGSSLVGEVDEETWSKYLNDQPWVMIDNEDSVMKPLKWSYDLMPAHLKQCFGYCSLLPKDTEIFQEDLIRKWIASGLIDSNGTSGLEDIGLRNFKSLVQLSFIEVTSDNWGQEMYVMHDLIHDLAQLVASRDCKVFGVNKYRLIENNEHPRHLIFDDIDAMGKEGYQKIRTLVANLPRSHVLNLNDFLEKLKYVRVLDITNYYCFLHEIDVKKIDFSCLQHLRYLKVPCGCYLSNSVTDLHNLQYLLCGKCPYGDIHLRHMGKLVNLRNLGLNFIVGKESGYKIEELGNLQELTGSLCIKNLERVESKEDAKKGRMKDKENLRELKLKWHNHECDSDDECNSDDECEGVLEGLVPHKNIQKVSIQGYMGTKFPNWVADGMALCNLQEMNLNDCRRLESLPAIGQLPQLKELCLKSLPVHNFPAWVGDKWQFPSLRTLRIEGCANLSSIPFGFSLLQELKITECGQSLYTYLETLCGRKAGTGGNIQPGPIFPLLKHLCIGSLQLLDNILGNAHTFCNASTLETVDVLLSRTETGEEFWGPEKSNDEKGDQWKEFTSLRRLTFTCCGSLLYLPPHLHRLPSLEELEIQICDDITAMPSGGLPKSLQRLTIFGYSRSPLKARCEKDTGLDWPKISHVPNLLLRW